MKDKLKTKFSLEDTDKLVDMLTRRLHDKYIGFILRIPIRKIRKVKEALRFKRSL